MDYYLSIGDAVVLPPLINSFVRYNLLESSTIQEKIADRTEIKMSAKLSQVDMIARLSALPFIAHLSAAQQAAVIDAAECRCYQEGEFIFSQHQPTDYLYVLLEGSIERTRYLPNGEKSTIDRVGNSGLATAQMINAILSLATHETSAIATAESCVLLLPRSLFSATGLLNNTMMQWMLQQMESQLREALYLADLLSLKSVEQRLCYYLYRQRDRRNQVTLPSTFRALAESLCIRHESLSRCLRVLEQKNVISTTKNAITIRDVAYLSAR